MADLRFHADDLGYTASSVAAAEELISSGSLTGVSLLVNLPGFRRAVLLLHSHPVPTALHVNLVEGVPVSPRGDIPSLVNGRGRFFPLPVFLLRLLLGLVNKKEVELEVAAQLSKARQERIAIVSLDSHRHTHMFSPIAEVFDHFSHTQHFSYIRSYGNFKTFTTLGFSKRLFVRFISLITSLVSFHRLQLPPSWTENPSEPHFVFLSWESLSFKHLKRNKKLLVVVHPSLSFDHPLR